MTSTSLSSHLLRWAQRSFFAQAIGQSLQHLSILTHLLFDLLDTVGCFFQQKTPSTNTSSPPPTESAARSPPGLGEDLPELRDLLHRHRSQLRGRQHQLFTRAQLVHSVGELPVHTARALRVRVQRRRSRTVPDGPRNMIEDVGPRT